jgi:Predicted periplasmic ligand-binding sensor domain
LNNLFVNALFEDSHTNLWAGTAGGLFHLQGERFEPVAGPSALRTPVMSLFEDRKGTLWAGSRGGLLRFRDNEIRVFVSRDGLGGAPVRALAEDRDGRLWVAIETAGIFRQDGERFEQFNYPTDRTSVV